MAKIVGMPRLSPTMEEGTLSRWVKHEGDDIALDDVIAEIETDKAMMEWRSFDVGVLLRTLASEGATLQPDAPIAIIGERGEDYSHLLSGAPVTAQSRGLEAKRTTKPHVSGAPAESDDSAGVMRVFASPSVRRLARAHSLDLQGVHGTGPHGRIIQRDVEQLLETPPDAGQQVGDAAPGSKRNAPIPGTSPQPRPLQSESRRERGRESEVIPLSATRRTIARRLVEAKQTIPHFYLCVDIDTEPLILAREELNRSLDPAEKISLNDLVIRACANTLVRIPAVNASFGNDSITRHGVVDISVAVAIPDGLVTPVVRDADSKGLLTIAREVRDLVARAQNRQLAPDEMTGGTFSVSNLGMYGIAEFAAVISPPQAAILAVGAIRTEPVVRDGALAVGRRMRVTLSCDHRVIDGVVGAEWLRVFRGVLEHPLQLAL